MDTDADAAADSTPSASSAGPAPEHEPHAGSDKTLVEALNRLHQAGYTCDFTATEDGDLACGECGTVSAPEEMQIDERVRFEGASNPDDQAIILGLTCSCGCRGTYVTAYGPTASAADAKVLRRIAAG